MPCAFIPPGYRAVLVGQAVAIEGLGAFAPLEEGAAEGALVLLELDFAEPLTPDILSELEQACRDAGIEPWSGSEFYVFADATSPAVYLAWQKGFAWLPIIIGLVATMVLPPLLMAGLWLILPDSLKTLISNLVDMGVMLLVMWIVTKMMPAPSREKEKPKQAKETSG